ncbi:hypothetical protein Cgig2_003671 [Carnegiea gigantea]|uniref:DUF4283 domain-containing protein n=1 Tax=Carnegiea gigantea TaxID=171969 RepID=A0A9Q1GSP3_9CARY|nr:hypothetical protein Cgig2_003671 [Carnegiea gigantea]
MEGRTTVLQRGLCYLDGKLFIVKVWDAKMNINTEDITSLPILVQFPDLDIKYWSMDILNKLESVLGIPIKTDKHTKERSMIQYACMLIDIPLTGDFPEFIEFINEVDLVVRQPVKYEWKPTKCEHRQMFGHTLQNCRKRNKTKMVWREVAKGNATSSDAAHHNPLSPGYQEDFIKVSEKHIARSPRRIDAEEQALTQNHFQALIKQEVPVLCTGLRPALRKLNRDKYHDLHAQQGYARERLEQIQTQLAMDPTNLQLKQEEEGYRD